MTASTIPQEVLNENRFLAARDGIDAELIDPDLATGPGPRPPRQTC